MVMKNKALICALQVLINCQYTSNKQLVNGENWSLKKSVTTEFIP